MYNFCLVQRRFCLAVGPHVRRAYRVLPPIWSQCMARPPDLSVTQPMPALPEPHSVKHEAVAARLSFSDSIIKLLRDESAKKTKFSRAGTSAEKINDMMKDMKIGTSTSRTELLIVPIQMAICLNKMHVYGRRLIMMTQAHKYQPSTLPRKSSSCWSNKGQFLKPRLGIFVSYHRSRDFSLQIYTKKMHRGNYIFIANSHIRMFILIYYLFSIAKQHLTSIMKQQTQLILDKI